mmetsp:Transcript_27534/g.30895  ORF Transcript_27534/g.30895 Transcript_27534/m.30895 type:complete len:202 (-) Transcript_27534:8-613(-)
MNIRNYLLLWNLVTHSDCCCLWKTTLTTNENIRLLHRCCCCRNRPLPIQIDHPHSIHLIYHRFEYHRFHRVYRVYNQLCHTLVLPSLGIVELLDSRQMSFLPGTVNQVNILISSIPNSVDEFFLLTLLLSLLLIDYCFVDQKGYHRHAIHVVVHLVNTLLLASMNCESNRHDQILDCTVLDDVPQSIRQWFPPIRNTTWFQ